MVETKQFEGHNVNPAMAPKLTDWKNEPSAVKLDEDLRASKEAHDSMVTQIDHWSSLMKVSGKAAAPKIRGRSSVQPKLIRRQAEWRYSALTEPFLSSDKMFEVKPTTFEDDEGAKQNEIVLNWQFRTKINRVNLIDTYIRANVDEGSAILRTGWKRVTKMGKKTVPVWTYMEIQSQEEMDMLQQSIEAKMADPRTFEMQAPEEIKAAVAYYEETGQPNMAEQTGEEEVDDEIIVENRPTIETVNPRNFYFDPSCNGDIGKANYVIYSFDTSQAELKKEPNRYKNLDYVNWEGSNILAQPDHVTSASQTQNFADTLRKRVVAYEYWGYYDIYGTGELVPIVATWLGGTMIRMELNPYPDQKPPFVVSNYMPILREVMGEADAAILEDNQKVLGALTRGMIDLMGRSANSQQGFAKGLLDVVNKRRYENGQDYEFNPNMNPEVNIVNHKYPEIPQSAMMMVAQQNNEAEALTGVKAFSGGMSGEAYGDVAAGIRGALDAASKREMGILRRLAAGLIEAANKIMAMNALFLSEKEVIRVTNKEFITIKREDLQGNFDLSADISTAEIDNNKAQDLGFMLQTIGNNMDFGITQIILAEIARLKRMPVLENQIKSFQPKPDPMQQKIQELSIKKLEMEIAELESKVLLNQAKAQESSNKADAIDLDTTEQETGTKHERDMEAMRGQSQGNQNLEVTKALLKPRKKTDGGETEPEVEAAVGFNEISKGNGQPRRELTPLVNGVETTGQRDQLAQADPRLSVTSQYYDPALDPAMNPAIGI